MNIQDYYKYSQLSALAYVKWRPSAVGSSPDNKIAIADANAAGRMPGETNPLDTTIDTLGEKFFLQEGWQVTDFHPNDSVGFKASLFTNSATGEKVLSIAGTEPDVNPYADLIKADLQEIGDYGMAISQAVSLFNYVQLLKAPTSDTDVLQLELKIDYIIPPSGDYVTVGLVPPRYLSVVASQTGTGGTGLGLLDPTDQVTITGHSLGGHLAAIGQRLFPDLFDSTVTFNAPGFDPLVGVSSFPIVIPLSSGEQLTDEFINTLFAPHLTLTTPPLADFGNISVMVSEDSVPGDDGSGVSSTLITGTQPGTQQFITTEQNSHMIEPFMDSLAVQALLEQLNPNIGFADAGALIKAVSDDPGKSIEIILDSLSTILLGVQSVILADNPVEVGWISAGDFLKRTAIHNRIIELETAISGQNLSIEMLGITDSDGTFTSFSPSEIETLARGDVAYRYALVNLNTFAVVGADADYTEFNQNGELDLYNSSTEKGQLSDMYLTDRSEMLFHLIVKNINDGYNESIIRFEDKTSGQVVFHSDPQLVPQKTIVFGSDQSDELEGLKASAEHPYIGDNFDDHLYGMAGDDTLKGNGGDDILEGGAGSDIMNGGSGDDTFIVHGTDEDPEAFDTFNGDGEDEKGDKILGGDRDDTIRVDSLTSANSIEKIDGQGGVNVIAGTSGSNTIDLTGITVSNIDRIEGGAGADSITGTTGDDILYGASGDGYDDWAADYLMGETGNDTYYIGIGDTINDSDHQGTIWYGANQISNLSFSKISETSNVYTNDNYRVILDTDINTLHVFDRNNMFHFTIENYNSGDFGLTFEAYLAPELQTPEVNGITIHGDLEWMEFYNDDGDLYYKHDDWGNYITDPNASSPGKADSLRDSPGNDHLFGYGGVDLLQAVRGGNDTLEGGSGDDWIKDDSGADTLIGGLDSDALFGGADNDTLYADVKLDVADIRALGETNIGTGARGDLLSGLGGNDNLYGWDGNDALVGGLGDDIIYGGAGDDIIDGDANVYWVNANVPWEVTRTIENDGSLYRRTYSGGISAVWYNITEHGNDTIYGGAGDDWIFANGGDDFIDGGSDNDIIFAEAGDDVVLGGGGNDHLIGDNSNDIDSEQGRDLLDGGAGDDQLWGHGKDDILLGGSGEDRLTGGSGHDILYGGSDNDILWGDNGDNTGIGNDYLYGGAGDDQLQGAGGADHLYGGADKDNLLGQEGNDYLYGGSGEDNLWGGKGDDKLFGGDGNDLLMPGDGYDVMDGGKGDDIYYYHINSGIKRITDSEGHNLLILRGIFGYGGISMSLGSLMISSGSPGDELHLDGVDYDNLVATSPIDVIEFEGGQTMTMAELIEAVGIDIAATEETDTLRGTSGRDNINALGGDDVVDGRAGNDIVDLGAGNDIAHGGDGNDTITGATGNDTIHGDNGYDTLHGNEGDDHLYGGTGNDILSGGQGLDTLEGGLGNDTITGDLDDDILHGNEGDDTLNGGSGQDTLYGGSGNDTLDGGIGADIMEGGLGNDNYLLDNESDTVTEQMDEGIDTVIVNRNYALGSNLENLQLSEGASILNGTGNELDNTIEGNSLDNTLNGLDGSDTLIGNSGNDILDGGTGSDLLQGGTGDDQYLVDNSADTITEASNAGTDRVISTVSYTLAANVEELILQGPEAVNGTGSSGDNIITGNDLDNILEGGSGNDELIGGAGADTLIGGTGADHLIGGSGSDIYGIDNINDTVTESVGEGVDTVNSSISYTLGENLEHLTLTDTFSINGTGNSSNNTLTGNSANNILNGEAGSDELYGGAGSDRLIGGAGADLMQGGAGNDTYVVDNINDTFVEFGGQGNDTVEIGMAITLGANLENAVLTGSGNITAIGNELDNRLTGNSGDNLLDGKVGNDFMEGGFGNDTYYTDTQNDTIFENEAHGIDTEIRNYETLYLLGNNVENLTLTGTVYRGNGNELDNVISGNDVANNLWGREGNDSLYGKGGDDMLMGASGDDHIEGNSGNDLLAGDSGNDTLLGGTGDDQLDGGAGINTLRGGTGDDKYVYRADGGVYEINNSDGGTDWLLFTDDITIDRLDFIRSADDLVVRVDGDENRQVIVEQWFNGSMYQIEYIQPSGGNGIPASQINSMFDFTIPVDDVVIPEADTFDSVQTGTTSAEQLVGTTGEDLLEGLTGDDQLFGLAGNDWLVAGEGNDYLDGGDGDDFQLGGAGNDQLGGDSGNDILIGDAGDDRYVFKPGSGSDIIDNRGGGTDWLLFDASLTIDKLIFTRVQDDLVIKIEDSTDMVTVKNWFVSPGYQISYIQPGGGSGIPASQIESMLTEANSGFDTIINGTAAGESLTGTSSKDQINAGNGNDKLYGYAGHDELNGGSGNDWIRGGTGADTLNGGTGNDTLHGGIGSDILDGGEGRDKADYRYSSAAVNVSLATGTATGGDAEGDTFNSIENLAGSGYNDTLTGTDERNALYGNGGNDELNGRGGNDWIRGGTGTDTLNGGTGNDTLHGGIGADILNGGDGRDKADYRYSSASVGVNLTTGVATGGDADGDTFASIENLGGSRYNDTLTGTDERNYLYGNHGDDLLSGGAGNDWMRGGAGNDILHGDAGNDTLIGGTGADILDGGDGRDKADYRYSDASVGVNLEAGIATGGNADGDTFASIENLGGSRYNDTLTGTDERNYLYGNYGDDLLSGGAGNDWIRGDAGNDTLNGDAGNDSLYGSDGEDVLSGGANNDWMRGGTGNDILHGDAGNDTLIGGIGADILDGGDGRDKADYRYSSASVDVNLTTGVATGGDANGDTFSLIENLGGSQFADSLTGDDTNNGLYGNGGNDVLSGGGGNDWMRGGASNDTLHGGAGNDTLHGGAGADILDGGEGRDKADYRYSSEAVTVSLADGTATGGDAEGDTFTAIENLAGSQFNDTLTGSDERNVMYGNGGGDILFGGLGNDYLKGGAGNDTFVFNSALDLGVNRDTIADFTIGQDKIELNNSIFTSLVAEGMLSEDNFHSSATSAAADENDYIIYNTTSGSLFYDADGNGAGVAVEFAKLTSKPEISANDFVIVS